MMKMKKRKKKTSAILAYLDGMQQTGIEITMDDLVRVFVYDEGNIIPSVETEEVLMSRALFDQLIIYLLFEGYAETTSWGLWQRVNVTEKFTTDMEHGRIRYTEDYVFHPVNFRAPSEPIWLPWELQLPFFQRT
jgi:hypothetical protein